MTTTTTTQIKVTAAQKGLAVDTTIIGGPFYGKEYLAVSLSTFVTAFFLVGEDFSTATYSHTYSALTDKTTKKVPAGF